MKQNTVVAIALCLMFIATVGGAASSIEGALSSLPGHEDVLAAAKGSTPGTTPLRISQMAGYQGVLGKWRGMPGQELEILELQEMMDHRGLFF